MDENGVFIGFCSFYKHRGIVKNGRLRDCITKYNCIYLNKFRIGRDYPLEGLVIKTEIKYSGSQTREVESKLEEIGESLKDLTQESITKLLEKENYNITTKALYPREGSKLKGCPFDEERTPKPKNKISWKKKKKMKNQ